MGMGACVEQAPIPAFRAPKSAAMSLRSLRAPLATSVSPLYSRKPADGVSGWGRG